jgi:glycosyltransferase involved in cell wall biosynthesis
MEIWILQTGEPVHSDKNSPRPMRAMNLADKLVNQGHRVILWTSAFHHQTKTHRSVVYEEIDISQNLQIRLIPSIGYKRNISFTRFYDHCVLAWNLRKLLKRCNKDPDVAFVGYPPIEAAFVMSAWLKKRQIPFLVDVKDAWPHILVESFPSPLKLLVRMLLALYYLIGKKSIQNATGICTHTSSFLDWSLTFSDRNISTNDFVAPLTAPSYDVDCKSLDNANEWWSSHGVVKTSALRIMFVGGFQRIYDFETVFLAASMLRDKNVDCEFIICGAGERDEELRSIAEHHENVKVFGWINTPKIKALSLMSNVAITPYKSSDDFTISIPNKVIDSLMLGLPVLNPLKGEVHELINQNSIGLNYHDSSDLCDRINYLIANNELQKNMSINAKNLYKSKFEFNSVYDSLVKHLEDIKIYE